MNEKRRNNYRWKGIAAYHPYHSHLPFGKRQVKAHHALICPPIESESVHRVTTQMHPHPPQKHNDRPPECARKESSKIDYDKPWPWFALEIWTAIGLGSCKVGCLPTQPGCLVFSDQLIMRAGSLRRSKSALSPAGRASGGETLGAETSKKRKQEAGWCLSDDLGATKSRSIFVESPGETVTVRWQEVMQIACR
jgi:hypothetical protein